MPAEIDYPLPGATVCPVFYVGGTYETSDKKKSVKTVTVTLYESDGTTVIGDPVTTNPGMSPDSGFWSVIFTDLTPPHSACVLKAQLFDAAEADGDPDVVSEIDIQAIGGIIGIAPTGP